MSANPTPTRILEPRIAVLIPCLNEEKAIVKVISDFKSQLPQAEIVVFDNASTDKTSEVSRLAGASVYHEQRRGKGFVVQTMFEKIDADIYILVDGDDTYPADRVKSLMRPVLGGEADMSVGSRITGEHQSQFRWLNLLGNKFYLTAINKLFNTDLTDILSGYRCMTRSFVKGIPIFVTGFEVEVELTIKSLERGYRIVEVPVNLGSRPEGSFSKINYVRDGLLILVAIVALFRDYKPLTFFGLSGLITVLLGFIPGVIVIYDFLVTGVYSHLFFSILSVGLVLTGGVLFSIGLILHTINRRIQELEHLIRLLVDQHHR